MVSVQKIESLQLQFAFRDLSKPFDDDAGRRDIEKLIDSTLRNKSENTFFNIDPEGLSGKVIIVVGKEESDLNIGRLYKQIDEYFIANYSE